ncbi:MAG: SH3 domain-containing protein [Sphingomonadaceae bacterium]
MKLTALLAPAILLLLSLPGEARAQEAADGRSAEALRNTSGLPVPRFMSLRAERANLRAGPGTSYPARWTFIRPGVPLEVIAEYNVWRQVRDAEGETGWMDRAMLSTVRTFQITREVRTLHARPDITSPPVWKAEPGVVGRIVTCEQQWCRIEVDGRSGWILREQGFGTYPGEPVRN